MSNRLRNIAASAGLLALSLSIAFGLGEVAVRRFASQPIHPGRQLFLSSPQFELTQNGAVRYSAWDTVRMVAVYDGGVEFDVTFVTNNYGFVDAEAYPLTGASGDKAYAFIGNSFAAGVHGGRPWIPHLRALVKRSGTPKAIYNLGVEGTGFWHFLRLLEFIKNDLTFDVVVIIAISDDFRRPYWRPVQGDSSIYLCPSAESRQECLGREPYASLFDKNTDRDSLLRLAGRNTGKQLLLRDPMRFLSLQAKRSQLVVLLVRQIKNALGVRPTFSFEGFKALADQEKDRDLYLLHVPQSNEVANGRYDVDPSRVAHELGATYVPLLKACKWDPKMYYKTDSHPNARGYENLEICVGRVLWTLP
jgi:hypothetical protein